MFCWTEAHASGYQVCLFCFSRRPLSLSFPKRPRIILVNTTNFQLAILPQRFVLAPSESANIRPHLILFRAHGLLQRSPPKKKYIPFPLVQGTGAGLRMPLSLHLSPMLRPDFSSAGYPCKGTVVGPRISARIVLGVRPLLTALLFFKPSLPRLLSPMKIMASAVPSIHFHSPKVFVKIVIRATLSLMNIKVRCRYVYIPFQT